MKFIPFHACLAAIALTVGCAQFRVESSIDPSYDLDQIQTYQWIDAPEEILKQDDTLLDLEMMRALNNQLADRGWTQVVDITKASVWVSYHVKIRNHREYSVPAQNNDEGSFSGGLVIDSRNKTWSYRETPPDRITYFIDMATLHFRMVDARNGATIWNGTVETEIDLTADDDKKIELFRKIARKLFIQLPPPGPRS